MLVNVYRLGYSITLFYGASYIVINTLERYKTRQIQTTRFYILSIAGSSE